MIKLSNNWLTEGLIDFEYKKYILMAYLQNAKKQFGQKKVYPHLSDLVFHYKNLLTIQENKELMYKNFPERISKADFEKLKITYKKIVEDGEVMKQIEEIVLFSIPKIKNLLGDGKEIYEMIDEKIEISQVGISPIYPDEGYMFINEFQDRETKIYRYQVTVFESAEEKFRGINTSFVQTIRKGIGETYENIKLSLIRQHTFLPNPATYLININIACPFNESAFPIAKRALVRFIHQNAA